MIFLKDRAVLPPKMACMRDILEVKNQWLPWSRAGYMIFLNDLAGLPPKMACMRDILEVTARSRASLLEGHIVTYPHIELQFEAPCHSPWRMQDTLFRSIRQAQSNTAELFQPTPSSPLPPFLEIKVDKSHTLYFNSIAYDHCYVNRSK